MAACWRQQRFAKDLRAIWSAHVCLKNGVLAVFGPISQRNGGIKTRLDAMVGHLVTSDGQQTAEQAKSAFISLAILQGIHFYGPHPPWQGRSNPP